jgi:hypothetical protein
MALAGADGDRGEGGFISDGFPIDRFDVDRTLSRRCAADLTSDFGVASSI